MYKPDGTGSDLKWISDDIPDYSGMNLKTNKDTKDQSELIEMLDAINHGGDIEKYLDVDEMLRYFAVNTAVVNLDHYQGNLKHNYYLYEENGVFSILPWDYNMSFGGFGVGGMGAEVEADQGKLGSKTTQASRQKIKQMLSKLLTRTPTKPPLTKRGTGKTTCREDNFLAVAAEWQIWLPIL